MPFISSRYSASYRRRNRALARIRMLRQASCGAWDCGLRPASRCSRRFRRPAVCRAETRDRTLPPRYARRASPPADSASRLSVPRHRCRIGNERRLPRPPAAPHRTAAGTRRATAPAATRKTRSGESGIGGPIRMTNGRPGSFSVAAAVSLEFRQTASHRRPISSHRAFRPRHRLLKRVSGSSDRCRTSM